MRPLTEKEAQLFFERLVKLLGANVESLLTRDAESWTFCEQQLRVYYMGEEMARTSSSYAQASAWASSRRRGGY
jgi:hypothetical protein